MAEVANPEPIIIFFDGVGRRDKGKWGLVRRLCTVAFNFYSRCPL